MPQLRLNAVELELELDAPGSSYRADDPLLGVLHEQGLTAAKLGCGLGQCGACVVMVDGRIVTSCDLPIGSLQGQTVLTLEGLRESDPPLFDALVRAFEDEQAAQCGYCSAGILMRAAHWLRSTPIADALSRGQVPQAQAVDALLEPHLCRCGSHLRIRRAVLRCAATLAGRA